MSPNAKPRSTTPQFDAYRRGELTAQTAINLALTLDETLAIIREFNYRNSGDRDGSYYGASR